MLLQCSDVDNRALAPLWGLRSDIVYDTTAVPAADPFTSVLAPDHCLFVNITDPLDLGGYPFVQVPADDLSWDDGDLSGAVIVGRSPGGKNVVTRYDEGSYEAFYISYMPEYQDGSAFEAAQWLYNAVVCTPAAVPVKETSWGAVKGAFR